MSDTQHTDEEQLPADKCLSVKCPHCEQSFPHHEELVMLVEYDLRSGTYTLRDFRTGEILFSLLTHGMAIERLDAPYETCIALLMTAKRLAYVASKRTTVDLLRAATSRGARNPGAGGLKDEPRKYAEGRSDE